MSLFDTLKSALGLGKGSSNRGVQRAIVRALEAKPKLKGFERVQRSLVERLEDYAYGSPIDWKCKKLAHLWDTSIEERSTNLANLVKLLAALFPVNDNERHTYVYSFSSTEGLTAYLEGDIWLVAGEILKRKTELRDETAAHLATRLLSHYRAQSAHILNAIVDASTRPEFTETRTALRKLQLKLSLNSLQTNFVKTAKAKLATVFPEEVVEAEKPECHFPEIKWVSWNSIERLKDYVDDAGGTELLDSHLATIVSLQRRLSVDDRRQQVDRLQELKASLTKRTLAGQKVSMAERTELADLSGYEMDEITRSLAWEKLQSILILAERLKKVDAEHRVLWNKWKRLAIALKGKSEPAKSWIKAAREEFKGTSRKELAEFLVAIIDGPDWPPRLAGGNADTIRAAIFGSINLPAQKICTQLAKFSEKYCFVTVPQLGICSEKLGNACLWALVNRPNGEGIPHLSRLQLKIKYPKVKAKIGAALDEAAKAAGITRGALEERSFRDFGLNAKGERFIEFGGGGALISLDGVSRAKIKWRVGEGKLSDSPQARLKAHPNKIKEARALAKDIESELSASQMRLQRIWLDDRSWPGTEWLERYVRHPVMGQIARRLIWTASLAGSKKSFIFPEDLAQDITGSKVDLDDTTITLWHPVLSDVREVLAWRNRLRERKLTQPFKQAHREVYLATPAEIQTDTYSNRFAGHILKQHQLVSLARLNGWSITHRISADTPNDAPTHLVIPAHGLVAEYWTEAAGGEDAEWNDAGAYLYLSTDQLRFYKIADPSAPVKRTAYGPDRGEVVAIKDVPKIVLSEVMRHCDLFVGVASVANDPNWRDGGAAAQHPNQWRMTAGAEYWERQSFGELDQSSETRKQLLLDILPALTIGDACKVEGRFLHVRGKFTTYKIHLGSGNILMEPNDRYLCIVPSHSKSEPSAIKTLPFEGDAKLSIILSKAILLADDGKITDQS